MKNPHLQQLFGCKAELRQDLGNLLGLFCQSVGHGRHHGGALPTAAVGQEEADVAVGNQTPDCLMKTTGISKIKAKRGCQKHRCRENKNFKFKHTHCGCILYREPSMPTVVLRRPTPLFSFSLIKMPARTAATRLAER